MKNQRRGIDRYNVLRHIESLGSQTTPLKIGSHKGKSPFESDGSNSIQKSPAHPTKMNIALSL